MADDVVVLKWDVEYKGEVVLIFADKEYEAKMKACLYFGLKGAECAKLKPVPHKEPAP